MEWEIISFLGMGPIRFGMTPQQVAGLIGPADRSRTRGMHLREQRDNRAPVIAYRNNRVAEIEGFYDLKDVKFDGISIFGSDPLVVLRYMEEKNGGCLQDVGILLFENIGISAGRLDEEVRENHSVTAFTKGLWEDLKSDMKQITFQKR